MPALPTAKRQMLRSLGVTRDGRAVEGLLACVEALTRGGSLWAISPFAGRASFVCAFRFSRYSEGDSPIFADAKIGTVPGERRRKDCCYQPLGITGLACARARLGPWTPSRAGVRKSLRRKTR